MTLTLPETVVLMIVIGLAALIVWMSSGGDDMGGAA